MINERLNHLKLWMKPGRTTELDYIHIGKCGGETVWQSILESNEVKKRFNNVRRTHINKPIYKKRTQYIFVIRNPIDRALSAFNWRYKLVVEDALQKDRFPGEFAILEKYRTLENLAISLFDGGKIDKRAAKDFRQIHHLREDVNYYMENAAKTLSSDQVFAVLCQRTLDRDIERYLGVTSAGKMHENKKVRGERLGLSAVAKKNLAKFLEKDFDCIREIHRLFPLDEENMEYLLKV